MNFRHSLVVTCIALSGALTSAATFAQTPMPPPQYAGNVIYVTGGIGSDEAAAFKRVRNNYALSLNFSEIDPTTQHAAYVSDVQVVIRNEDDYNVLNTRSDGPYFYVQIPVGTYQLHATHAGQTQSRTITISEQPTALDLKWQKVVRTPPAEASQNRHHDAPTGGVQPSSKSSPYRPLSEFHREPDAPAAAQSASHASAQHSTSAAVDSGPHTRRLDTSRFNNAPWATTRPVPPVAVPTNPPQPVVPVRTYSTDSL